MEGVERDIWGLEREQEAESRQEEKRGEEGIYQCARGAPTTTTR
jgi:hypothetical protein